MSTVNSTQAIESYVSSIKEALNKLSPHGYTIQTTVPQNLKVNDYLFDDGEIKKNHCYWKRQRR